MSFVLAAVGHYSLSFIMPKCFSLLPCLVWLSGQTRPATC